MTQGEWDGNGAHIAEFLEERRGNEVEREGYYPEPAPGGHSITPWESDNTRENYGKHVIRHNGMIIATIGHDVPIGPSQAKANARLIAAAPDLLEACRFVRDFYQRTFDVMPVAFQTVDDICAQAIAKAEEAQS